MVQSRLLLHAAKQLNYTSTPLLHPHSLMLCNILCCCWMSQVMGHEFFRGLDWKALLEKRIKAPLNPCRNQSPGSSSTQNFDPQYVFFFPFLFLCGTLLLMPLVIYQHLCNSPFSPLTITSGSLVCPSTLYLPQGVLVMNQGIYIIVLPPTIYWHSICNYYMLTDLCDCLQFRWIFICNRSRAG